MSKVIDKVIISPKAPSNKNTMWYDGKSLHIYNNGEWSNGNSTGNRIVNNIEELGALDVSLGTVASVVNERHEVVNKEYEVVEEFGKHKNDVDKPIVGGINIIGDIPILGKEYVGLYFTNNTALTYGGLGGFTHLSYMNMNNGHGFTIYASYSGFSVDELHEVNSLLSKQEHRLDYIEGSDTVLNILDSFLQGVFVYHSEVDIIKSEVNTYIKTEKGLDLPTPIYRKFRDFGEQPELFPKEERVVKNFEIIGSGDGTSSGSVVFETQGGTIIDIYTNNYVWVIRYDDSESMSLDDVELQKFKDLVNSTNVYYIINSGHPHFKSLIDSMVSADFPLIYKPVELKTWSKVYTEQDVLSDTEIDNILNEVFGGGYYYYGDEGIGTFDLDEGQVVEEAESVNIENDETNSQS